MRRFCACLWLLWATIILFASAGEAIPPVIIEGTIIAVEDDGGNLKISYDRDAEVSIKLHSQGICLKEKRRRPLSAFKIGDKIVVVPSGGESNLAAVKLYENIRGGSKPIEALAIQDAVSYHSGSSLSGAVPVLQSQSAIPVTPKQDNENTYNGQLTDISPELRDKLMSLMPGGGLHNDGRTGPGTGVGEYDFVSPKSRNTDNIPVLNQGGSFPETGVPSNSGPLTFGETEGKITAIEAGGKNLSITVEGGISPLKITTGDKTKIYRFSNNQFDFLTLSQLKPGDKVRVSGFRRPDGSLDAMMVILLNK